MPLPSLQVLASAASTCSSAASSSSAGAAGSGSGSLQPSTATQPGAAALPPAGASGPGAAHESGMPPVAWRIKAWEALLPRDVAAATLSHLGITQTQWHILYAALNVSERPTGLQWLTGLHGTTCFLVWMQLWIQHG